jgi:hypothetical protein
LPSGAVTYEDLLQLVVQKGKVLDAQPDLAESRQRAINQQALFHLPAEPYLTGMDRALYDLRSRFVQPETAASQ